MPDEIPRFDEWVKTRTPRDRRGGSTLSPDQIANTLRQAGWDERDVPTMTAIAQAESFGNPTAHNPKYPDDSYGLLQVNRLAHPQYSPETLRDPVGNAKAALDIFKKQGLRAWSTYTSGAYKKHLRQSPPSQSHQIPKFDKWGPDSDIPKFDDWAKDSEQNLPPTRRATRVPTASPKQSGRSAPSTYWDRVRGRMEAQPKSQPAAPMGIGDLRRQDELRTQRLQRVRREVEAEQAAGAEAMRQTPSSAQARLYDPRLKIDEEVLRRYTNPRFGRSPEEIAAAEEAERQRRERVSKLRTSEKLAQAPKSAGLGLAQTAETSLKSIAVLSKKLNLFGEYTGKSASDLATYKAGEYISKWARENLKSNPDLEAEFLVGKAPQAVGQAVSFLLGGIATKAPKLTVTILGAGMTTGSAYDEVIAAGGSEDEAINAGLLAGAVLGPTELIGMRGLMKAIQGTAREATLREALKTALREGRRDVVENALQEAGQEYLQGKITEVPRTAAQLLEAAALGGIAGTITTPVTLATQVGGRRGTQTEVQPTVEAQRETVEPARNIARMGSVDQVMSEAPTKAAQEASPADSANAATVSPQRTLDLSALESRAAEQIRKKDAVAHAEYTPEGLRELLGSGEGGDVSQLVGIGLVNRTPEGRYIFNDNVVQQATPKRIQRFYHKDWGEVEVLEDQSGARPGRVKVAEVADPTKQHFPRRSDLAGRGNQRMVPVKLEPSAESTVSPEAPANEPLRLNEASLGPDIAEHNRQQLGGEDFQRVLMRESIGGNAGANRAGVNMAVDSDGRIVAIGNIQDLPADTQEALRSGSLQTVTAVVKYAKGLSDPQIEKILVPQGAGKQLQQSLSYPLEEVSRGPTGVSEPANKISTETTTGFEATRLPKPVKRQGESQAEFKRRKTLADAESGEGKKVRAAPTHAIGRPKIDSTKNSVSVQARARGGIKPTENFRGEVDRLKLIEGHRRLVDETSGVDPEQMVIALAQDGYRLPGVEFDTGGQAGFKVVDVSAALEAIEMDARGIKPLHSTAKEFDVNFEQEYYDHLLKSETDKVSRESADALISLLENEEAGTLYERVSNGTATAREVEEFRTTARGYGVSDADTETLIRAGAENSPAETERLQSTPEREAQQLGFTQEGLTQESAPPPKPPDQRARLTREEQDRQAELNPKGAEALARLEEIKRRGMTVDDYARQPDLMGNVPSAEEIALLRKLESGEQASVPDQPQMPLETAAVVPDRHALRKPIKGNTGAEIVGYRWNSREGEKYSEREGGLIPARVSNWEEAGRSEGTGRQIVHEYFVKHPDGRISIEGIRSAQNILGINESRLQTIAKREREAQMTRARQLEDHAKALEQNAKDSAAEAAADYRKRNYSAMRTFEQNDALFQESTALTREGKFVRVSSNNVAMMKERGWQEVGGENFGPGTMRAGEPLPEVKERKFGKRFTEDERIADEIRSEIGTAKYYEPIPNKITAAQATKLVDERGIGESIRIIRDEKNDLPAHIRSTMGQIVIQRLNQTFKNLKAAGSDKAEAVLDQAADLAEWAMDYGTRLGQGVQSFAMWARLTPEGKLLTYKRAVAKARERHQKLYGEEVAEIVNAVNKEGMTDAERVEALTKLFKTNKTARKIKTDIDKVVAAAKAGKLTDTLFYEIVGDRLGLPGYNREVAERITDLAHRIDEAPEGLPRNKLVQELQKFIAEQKGFDVADLPLGIFYGNILSGYNTHAVNFADTGLNVLSEINGLALSNPKAAAKIYSGLLRGFSEGRFDALLELTQGRMVTDGKWLEVPRLMEVAKFGKKGGVPIKTETKTGQVIKKVAESKIAIPLNAYKYVTRAMAASDALMFRAAKEARASLLAYKMAKAEGLTGHNLEARVREILALDREGDFAAQARREGFTGKEAEFRAKELRELVRDKDLTADAAEFAGEATYNHVPHGTLGLIAERVGKIAEDVKPLKLFVPFTRIVANVTNRGLNYTPYGYKRAFMGWGFGKNAEPLTAEGRRLMLTRATLGTAGMVLLAGLQEAGVLQIHGNGPSDREKRRQLQNAGWRPYSLQIGDTYVSYVYSPVGLGLSIVGNMTDSQRYHELEQKDAATKGAYAVARLGSTIFSQSFLSGLSRLFGALSERPDVSVNAVKQTLGGTAAAFTTPNIVRDIHRLFDNKAYQSNTLMEDLIRSTPFAALALKPQLNAFGEPVELQRQRFFDIQTSDPAWRFVIEKGLRVPVPGRTTEIEKGKRITPEQYYKLLQTTGPEIKQWILDNQQMLQLLPEQDAQDELQDAATAIRKRALDEMRGKMVKPMKPPAPPKPEAPARP